MQFAGNDLDKTLSSWKLDSEGDDVYVSGLREAETVVAPLVNNRPDLIDPPEQFKSQIIGTKEYDAALYQDFTDNGSSYEQLKETVNNSSNCGQRPKVEGKRCRRAPAVNTLEMNANTVEIVKKNGIYSVVLDGVSQGEIEKEEHSGSFGVTRHWMPRFHESVRGEKDNDRHVQPVLFSLRLEEFETPPESCYVIVRQRVVNQGTVVMDDKETTRKRIIPYSSSGNSMNVLALPYPIISTPTPYFVVNDFSKLLHFEVLAKCAVDKNLFLSYTDVMEMIANVSKDVYAGAKEGVGPTLDAVRRNTMEAMKSVMSSIKTLSKSIIELSLWATLIFLLSSSVSQSLASNIMPFADTTIGKSAVDVVGTLFGFKATNMFFFMSYTPMLQRLRSKWAKRGDNKDFFSPEEIRNIKNSHAAESTKPPDRHTIPITLLPKILHRIAETRANGSLVEGTEQTVGFGVHSLKDQGWETEAAFLHWLVCGSGDRKGAHPVTGLYSTDTAMDHSILIQSDTGRIVTDAAPSFNTIDYTGMDPLTLSNTRTQFFFEIVIREKNGDDGPKICLESTRMNGVDAGWIEAGFDNVMKDCVAATNCLESRLMAMPGVSRWMRTHTTLVVDANNGRIIGNDHDVVIDNLMDNDTTENGKKRVEKTIKMTDAKLKKAKEKENKASNTLSDARTNEQKLKADIAKVTAAAEEKRKTARRTAETQYKKKVKKLEDKKRTAQLNADDTILSNRQKRASDGRPPVDKRFEQSVRANRDKKLKDIDNKIKETHVELSNNQRLATRLQEIDKIEQKTLEKFKGQIPKKQSAVMNAEEKHNDTLQEIARLEIRKDAAGVEKLYAHVFDYDATIKRIKDNILGVVYTEFQDTGDAGDAGDAGTAGTTGTTATSMARSVEIQDSFWRRALNWPSADSIKRNAKIKDHVDACIFNTCMSLCLPKNALDHDSAIVMRFMNVYAPLIIDEPNVEVMRLASFVVPHARMWKTPPEKSYDVLRIMPQIVKFSEPYSSYNVARIGGGLQQRRSAESIDQAQVALRRTHKAFNLNTTLFVQSTCHIAQKYEWKQLDLRYNVFKSPVNMLMPIDLVATSFLPPRSINANLILADESGGSTLESITRLVAGKRLYGVSEYMEHIGIEKNISSLAAIATFAEIATFCVMQRGSISTGSAGFDLQKEELVENFMKLACESCRHVANFIVDAYVRERSLVKRPTFDDVAFSCIPGFAYTRIALRQLGILRKEEKNIFSDSLEKHHTAQFAKALEKIASSKVVGSAVPFLCLQSVASSVGPAVRMIQGYENTVVAHISAGILSFHRIQVGTHALRGIVSDRVSAAARVDNVCSRPILMKSCKANPSLVTAVAARALETKQQMQWQRPGRRLSQSALMYRLASLRVDFAESIRRDLAVDSASFLGKQGVLLANEFLVSKMNSLSTVGLSAISTEEKASATYFVPFGLTRSGTVIDVTHTSFAYHPVWIELLLDTSKLLTSSRKGAHSLSVYANTEGFGIGQLPHPLAVKAEVNKVGVFIHNQYTCDITSDVSPTIIEDTDSMIKIAQNIQEGGSLCRISGEMTETYRVTMFNTERLFQACLVLASRAHTTNSVKHLHAIMNVPDNVNIRHFAVCVCIANAMAASETGSSAAIILNTDDVDVDCVRNDIEVLGNAMIQHGILAVPFSEMCMIVSSM